MLPLYTLLAFTLPFTMGGVNPVGRIDASGNVYLGSGNAVGQIKSNGDVFKGGMRIGKVEGSNINRRWAALAYFFGIF